MDLLFAVFLLLFFVKELYYDRALSYIIIICIIAIIHIVIVVPFILNLLRIEVSLEILDVLIPIVFTFLYFSQM